MSINRALWESPLNKTHVPRWPCPRCGAAALAIVKDSFHTAFDAETVRARQLDRDYPSEGETGRFVCLLQCGAQGCKETCAVAGDYDTWAVDVDQGYDEFSSCTPISITPPPPVIQIPEECPEAVKQEVVAAFMLHWSDYASCLNRIRNALELLLTDLKVPRSTVNKYKKRVEIKLHARIEILQRKKPKLRSICTRMMAVKHLGNAGSHSGVEVERKDVFDGFDILERVLHDMYSMTDGELAKMVRQINKRKGPRKKAAPRLRSLRFGI
jgi:hypothetical protein